MSKQKEVHVLPADVFDALELSALVHGGIGSGCLSETKGVGKKDAYGDHIDFVEVPSCVIGHALFLDGVAFYERYAKKGEAPVTDALVAAFPLLQDEVEEIRRHYEKDAQQSYSGVTESFDSRLYYCSIYGIETVNDLTVDQYSTRKDEAKLSWKQWCKRMNVVRGDK